MGDPTETPAETPAAPSTFPPDYFKHYRDNPPPSAPASSTSPPAKTPEGQSKLAEGFEAGGAGVLGAGLAALAIKFPALRHAAADITEYIAKHPTLGGGGAGAVTGAVTATPGAISSGHPGDILTGAGTGAAIGATGANLLRGAGAGATRLAIPSGERQVASAVLGDHTQAVGDRLQALADQIRRGERGPVPNQQTVGEVLGPQSQALATAALRDPNPESQAYATQLAERQAGAGERTGDLVNQALAPDTYADAEKSLTTALKTNAKPFYDKAYSMFPKVQSDELGNILNNKFGQAASKRAFDLMKADGVPIGDADAVGMVQSPSLQYLDYVKRALDDQISTATAAGNRNQARIIGGMKDRLLTELDNKTTLPTGASPYAEARKQYQSDAQTLDALHSGLQDFPKMTPADLRAKMSDLDFSAQDAFRSGVAESLFRTIGKTPAGRNVPLKLINTPDMQEKMVALFDDPKKAQSFIDRLQNEATQFETAKTMLGAAGAQAPAAIAGGPGNVAKAAISGGLHSLTFNPKIVALRAAAHALLGGSGGISHPGDVSSIMRQTGAAGADQIGDIGDAAARLQKLRTMQNVGTNVGAIGGGAAAGAALTPAISRHDEAEGGSITFTPNDPASEDKMDRLRQIADRLHMKSRMH